MGRWMIGCVVAFFAVYSVTVLIAGRPEWILPVLVLMVLVLGYALVNWLLTRRVVREHGSLERAMSESDDPVPATHLIADDDTALGDTPEAHDEITPHDLPKSHPGRAEVEERLGDEGDRPDARTTRGDADPSEAVG
jgi:hypothetical protein